MEHTTLDDLHILSDGEHIRGNSANLRVRIGAGRAQRKWGDRDHFGSDERTSSVTRNAWSVLNDLHGIGARLLREYAEQIGLNPAFTIHDREDSADLMNLVRHERGLSKTESRFPTKGTCLSIYSRCVNAETELEEVLGASYPWCAGWTVGAFGTQ